MDPYAALERALAAAEPIVARVDTSQLDHPTCCTGWRVRDLINHMLLTLWSTESMFADSEQRHAGQPGGLPDVDIVGNDPSAAYAEAKKAILAAAAIEGTLERMHKSPLGEMPGVMFINLPITDVFVHGWDLARATGQQVDFDEELAERQLALIRQVLTDQRPPPPIFGPEVGVPDDRSAMDRLVGFLGRTP
jgi:uncharacterized protein (TIGR03086 family)